MEHIGCRNDKFTAIQPVGSIRRVNNRYIGQFPVKSIFTGQQIQIRKIRQIQKIRYGHGHSPHCSYSTNIYPLLLSIIHNTRNK